MGIFEHQAPREKIEKCLIKKCQDDAVTRGLCPKCYSIARLMMKKGTVAENYLIEKGMILPSRPKRSNLFKEQLLG
jgi:hypothetical protein